jgi:uncharacterized lipoprotein YajG
MMRVFVIGVAALLLTGCETTRQFANCETALRVKAMADAVSNAVERYCAVPQPAE